MTIPQAFALALQQHQAGRLAEAEALYRQILSVQPCHAEALHFLGVIAHQAGRYEVALDLIQKSIAFNPNNPSAYSNLGEAYRTLGRLDEAVAAYRRALQIKKDLPEAHRNLGNVLRQQGRLEEAIVALRSALESKPDWPEACNHLGNALRDVGQLDESVAAYHRAIDLRPDYPEAHNNLGAALAAQGKLDEARAACLRATQLQPDFPEARHNLGNALRQQGHLDEAIAEYQRALHLRPDFPETRHNLGLALKEQGHLDEAIAEYQRALELRPDFPEALINLANALKDRSQLDEAIAAYRRALALKPGAGAHSNLILALHFHPGHDAGMIAEEQARWNRRFGEPVKPFCLPHANPAVAERPLRVGYVSADFCDHVAGWNLLPLFKFHDPQNMEILCYSGVRRPDQMTEEFRQRARHWRGTVDVPDEALADQIRKDGVDILVDLALHTGGNRLPVFALQPAPVQVSFAGYPESTGLEAIEYRISDRHLEAGCAGSAGRKEQVCLIDSFWCYDPCAVKLEVNGLPAKENGTVTFGCLNNFCKVNEPLMRLWARVLTKVSDSRLLLLCGSGSSRQRTMEFLASQGVEARRVEFVDVRPRREYLETYQRLDIVLDTFPYNGHTTSLDALWMGVPVVSLAGDTRVSRGGLSILSNLGLPELVAHSEMEYGAIATELAGDLPRLADLRSTLRARMEHSVLMDAPRFARQVEQAFREMWRAWCAKTKDKG